MSRYVEEGCHLRLLHLILMVYLTEYYYIDTLRLYI